MAALPMTFGILGEIEKERHRQVEVEGYTPAHDDEHDRGQLAQASASYVLLHASKQRVTGDRMIHILRGASESAWPWNINERRSTVDRRTLVIAAALLVAEIERLDRAARCGAVAAYHDMRVGE